MKKQVLLLLAFFTLFISSLRAMETDQQKLNLLTLPPAPELQQKILLHAFISFAQEYFNSMSLLENHIKILERLDAFLNSSAKHKGLNIVHFANSIRSLNSYVKAIVDDALFKEHVQRIIASLLRDYFQEHLLEIIAHFEELPFKDKGITLLHWACLNDYKGLVEFLLTDSSTYDINSKDNEGETPLYSAIRGNGKKALKVLLAHPNIQVNVRNRSNHSPFFVALCRENLIALELLLNYNKLLGNLRNNKGENALHTAVHNDKLPLVRLLLNHSLIDINSENYEGNTPLHLAVQNTNKKIVELLLFNAKIDATIKNNSQQTPLELAFAEEQRTESQNKKINLKNIIQLLETHIKARQNAKNSAEAFTKCIIS